jgi:hypothetical protein
MKKHIAEELPARQFKQANMVANKESGKEEKGGKGAEGQKGPEDRIRQAVYDIRYRARREELPLKQAYSQYMGNSSMSQEERTAVEAKLFGESYGIGDFASTTVAKALFEVFVKDEEKNLSEDELLDYFREEQIVNSKGERKYKVEVVGKEGRSYVRYATREKINDLRLNPNIKSVEMTDKGEPYEGEKTRGQQTAAVKAGKDWDGDGKIESGSKEHAGSVHNAIQRKRGGVPDGQDTRRESVENIREIVDSGDEENEISNANNNRSKRKKKDQIDVLKKGEKNNVEVCPTQKDIMSSYIPHGTVVVESDLTDGQLKFYKMLQEKAVSQNQQQLAGMALAYLRGDMPDASEEVKKMAKMGEKKLRDFAKTKHEGLPEKVEEAKCDSSNKSENDEDNDPRDDYAKKNVLKNKIRSALGVKNPMVISASNEMEGEQIDEFWGPFAPKPKPTKNAGKPQPGSIKAAVNAIQIRKETNRQAMKELGLDHYEMEGNLVSEEERDNEEDADREERYGAKKSRGSGGVTRDSRGRVIMRNPNYRPSEDPRMGSNPRPRRRY